MFCALCAADNPNDGRFCVKCGALLQGQRDMPPSAPSFGAPAARYTGPTETSGKAIGSLICGIVFFFFPSAIAAIILGHLSLSDIRKSGGRLTGNGLATTGLVLGYIGISIIPIMIIAAIAIPNLLRARMAANEASAIGSVRNIDTAAFSYGERYSNGFPPGLAAMGGVGTGNASCDHAQLIDPILASGQKNGYMFTYVALPAMEASPPPDSPQAVANGCTTHGGRFFAINADPITRGTTGQRSFFADQTGVIRFNGEGPATSDSPVLQ
jgi:type IV pilus assembly protein PilA